MLVFNCWDIRAVQRGKIAGHYAGTVEVSDSTISITLNALVRLQGGSICVRQLLKDVFSSSLLVISYPSRGTTPTAWSFYLVPIELYTSWNSNKKIKSIGVMALWSLRWLQRTTRNLLPHTSDRTMCGQRLMCLLNQTNVRSGIFRLVNLCQAVRMTFVYGDMVLTLLRLISGIPTSSIRPYPFAASEDWGSLQPPRTNKGGLLALRSIPG